MLAHGQVPIFKTENGDIMLESGAMAMYLLEKYGGLDHALFGKPEQRPQLLQWLWYAPTTLYSAMGAAWVGDDAAKAAAKAKVNKQHLAFIARELGEKPFILGDDFTLADVFLGYELSGLNYLKWLDEYPKIVAYVDRVNERPSFKSAFGHENGEKPHNIDSVPETGTSASAMDTTTASTTKVAPAQAEAATAEASS